MCLNVGEGAGDLVVVAVGEAPPLYVCGGSVRKNVHRGIVTLAISKCLQPKNVSYLAV